MNRTIASVYAISIGSGVGPDGQRYTLAERQKLIDCIPPLISEVERMEKLLNDPFIAGYIKAKAEGCFGVGKPGEPK